MWRPMPSTVFIRRRRLMAESSSWRSWATRWDGWRSMQASRAELTSFSLPEILYDIDVVVNAIRSRTKNGKNFTILAVAEGAISKGKCSPDQERIKRKEEKCTGLSVGRLRAGRPDFRADGAGDPCDGSGHMQRGGEPCPYDRVIADAPRRGGSRDDPPQRIRLYGRFKQQ